MNTGGQPEEEHAHQLFFGGKGNLGGGVWIIWLHRSLLVSGTIPSKSQIL